MHEEPESYARDQQVHWVRPYPSSAISNRNDRSRIRKFCLFTYICFAISSTGCSLSGTLLQQAIDYNETVGDASNMLLVRNILRASDDAPVHFTTVPQVRGGASVSGSAGLTAPFGVHIDGNGGNSLSLGVAGSVSPTFDVAALDTQEFTRGLLEPIEPALFQYFWDRGFPRQLLLYLMVQRIEISSPERNGPLRVITNRPDSRTWEDAPRKPDGTPGRCFFPPTTPVSDRDDGCDLFRRYVAYWTWGQGGVTGGERITINSYTEYNPVGPLLSDLHARAPELLAVLASREAELRLRPDPSGQGFRLYRRSDEVAFCTVPQESGGQAIHGRTASMHLGLRLQPQRQSLLLFGGGTGSTARSVNPRSTRVAANEACNRETVVVSHGSSSPISIVPPITLYLRSVDQMIYYLGQVVRHQMDSDIPYLIETGTRALTSAQTPRSAYLFRLTPTPTGSDRFSVEYRGRRYYVPTRRSTEISRQNDQPESSARGDHTLQILSLLTHLINLKKRAEALPTTRAVQVVR